MAALRRDRAGNLIIEDEDAIADLVLRSGDDSDFEWSSDDETDNTLIFDQNRSTNSSIDFFRAVVDDTIEQQAVEEVGSAEISEDIPAERDPPGCSNSLNEIEDSPPQKRRKTADLPSKRSKQPSTRKKSPKPKWNKVKFQPKVINVNFSHQLNKMASPLEYFEKYYPDTFFEDTAKYTNMYCMSKFGKELKTDAIEMKKLYGMHLIMGCIKYPRLRMYWSHGISLEPISKAMTRDRFFLLRNSLHVVDTNNPPLQRDRLWKVQPVIDTVRNGCAMIERYPESYSVDEQMVPFAGKTDLKQYVPNKPRPVGLKNFVITTSSGILIDFELYQGSQTNLPAKSEMGLGPSVVLRLKDNIPPLSIIYFDRYFTTIELMRKLISEQYYATGTLALNRLQEISFVPDRELKRGQYEELCSPDNQLVAVKWKDNKGVVMLSTVCGAEPVTLVRRWSKKDSVFIDVDCPAAIVTYNKNMGGVDLFNQLMEVYRIWFKTKKWTLKVILHFLDLAVVNSWLQYRRDFVMNKLPKKNFMDLLKFRMSLAETLLSRPRGDRIHYHSSDDENEGNRPQNWRAPLPSVDKRKDGFDHWAIVDDLKTARACRNEGCTSRTRVRCEKCNTYLCLTKNQNCFKLFHTV